MTSEVETANDEVVVVEAVEWQPEPPRRRPYRIFCLGFLVGVLFTTAVFFYLPKRAEAPPPLVASPVHRP